MTALLPELKLDASVEAAATVSPETTAEPETTPEPIDEPAPESTAAPENTPEAQSAAIPEKYLGVWYGVSMEMEGVSYPLADMGMELTLTISADGAAEMNMNGEVERFQCAVRDGVLTAGAKTLTLQEGMLQLSEDSAAMLMSREKPEAAAEAPAPVDETATLDSFKGVWTASRVSAEGMTLPAAAADMAGDTLTVYGDTCDLTLSGYLLDGLPCHMDGHRLIFTLLDGECAVTRHTDGTLSLMLEEASVWYEYTGEAPEAPAVPTQEPMSEPTAEPMTEPTAAPAPAAPGAASMVGRKFVMTDADVSGYNMSAAMMGGFEYSILLREDGNVEFVMAGANIPSLTWSYGKVPTDSGEADGIVIAYPGQLLYLVPTEQGFDMDYFGTMLMHFAPEA